MGRVYLDALPDCPLQGVNSVGLVVGDHVGLIDALQHVGSTLLELALLDARLLGQLAHHAGHVRVIDVVGVLLERLHELQLFVGLVQSVKKSCYFWLIVVDAVLDEVLLLDGLEPGLDDLVDEVASVLLLLLDLALSDLLIFVDIVQLLLLLLRQLDHPMYQVLLLNPQIRVQLQQRVVSSPDELLQRDALIARIYVILIEEEDDKLGFDIQGELFDLRVIDLIEAQEIVVVIYGVDGVNKLVDVAVLEVDLEGRQDVEVRPGVQVKGYLELLLVYYPLLVEVVKQAIENLELLHLQVQLSVHNCPLSYAVVAALHLQEVLSGIRDEILNDFSRHAIGLLLAFLLNEALDHECVVFED